MTMKAVGTAAMEMVQEVEIQFDEVSQEARWKRTLVYLMEGTTDGAGAAV